MSQVNGYEAVSMEGHARSQMLNEALKDVSRTGTVVEVVLNAPLVDFQALPLHRVLEELRLAPGHSANGGNPFDQGVFGESHVGLQRLAELLQCR